MTASSSVSVTVRLRGEDYDTWCQHASNSSDVAEFLRDLFSDTVRGRVNSPKLSVTQERYPQPPQSYEDPLVSSDVERLRKAGYRILPGSVSKEPLALNRVRTCFWCDALGVPKRDRWMWQARMADFIDLKSGSNFAVRRCICEKHAALVLSGEEK